ncbi:hypothetical protein N9D31_03955 [Oligoflexaceae bacterium]|nr:hypothetical protein [Oligoflexaceae bacterium]
MKIKLLSPAVVILLVFVGCRLANRSELKDVDTIKPSFAAKLVRMMQNGNPVPADGKINVYKNGTIETVEFDELVKKTPDQIFEIMTKKHPLR